MISNVPVIYSISITIPHRNLFVSFISSFQNVTVETNDTLEI